MENILVGANIILLLGVGMLILIIYRLNTKKEATEVINYSELIQKNTSSLIFDLNGILISTTIKKEENQILGKLQLGDNISEFKEFKNIDKYFESCKKFKKTVSLKLVEREENKIGSRHDLIFTPIQKNEELDSILVISQKIVTKKGDSTHLTQNKELEEQRNYALKQIDEVEAQKSELELAFKKSSKHHIMLQKAMRKIETQKNDLEKALDTINIQKAKLEKANKEIRESSRMKEIFLANTSHEIRTPLNAILGFTNLLLNTDLELSQKKYLDSIKASGNNLLVVINDILDFSKIESGKLTLEQIDFDFRNLVKHTINTLTVKSQEKQIELKYDISDDIPNVIIGDPVRLNQILINLLGNAIKFTSSGGYVRLAATTGKLVDNKIKLLFKIEDNGIGVPKDKLTDIFQSFTQGESDTTRKFGGTGLGLSIVKQLIELQDGEIAVESTIGVGTSFTFYIMLKIGDDKNVVSKSDKRYSMNRTGSDEMKILLVEDNIINQQLAFDTIKTWNKKIEIDLADNGKIALEKIQANTYHLVLMDIQMPEMDGNEATVAIRKLDSEKCKIPIVAMTAHALKNEKENCLKMGMDDYISKPFDPEDLFDKILKFAPKNTKPINANKSKNENSQSKIPSQIPFNYFNTKNLIKIYHDNNNKIKKIVGMCFESIPNELIEIQKAFDNKEWDILRNKAHSLKPKLGYLGMEEMQNNAKKIELKSQEQDPEEQIQSLINSIKNHWQLATPEIKNFIT
ncbi:MAG: response regulator [Salinivirgaceae bacterium]|nr:response regulator [Salinivirgaceae bacterium]